MVEKRCEAIGKGVETVVNYDSFQIDEDLIEEYSKMVHYLVERYYEKVSRYTTSAFMRLKLGEALERRGLAAHIFDREQTGHATAADKSLPGF